MDLQQLSVVIPTYQRPVYALRNMHLLDQTGAQIHVLDGSAEPIDARRLAGLSTRVHYRHLPESYEARLAHAAELVDTPFCVAIGDDDMHMPSGLAASIDALHADADLVAATGTALAVLLEDGEVKAKPVYEALHGRAITADDPVQRMVDHLADYLPSTVYAVTRTPAWTRAVRALTERQFTPFRLGELQYEMAVAFAGKTAVVPHLMWLRSLENPSLWRTDDVPVAQWWEAGADRAAFGAYMGGVLTDDPKKRSIAAEGSLKAVDAYVGALRSRTALRRSLTPAQKQDRWPTHPVLPLTEWGRRIAESGVVVDEADLGVASAAIAATPIDLAESIPAPWTSA